MRRLLVVFAALVAVLAGSFSVAAAGGTPTSASACGGKLIINVTLKSINNYDSGVNGNAWANDSINRHVQVFDVGGGNYCATVDDQGQFVTFAGDSPGGVVNGLSAGVKGNINGGYRTTVFGGTLNPSPAYATKGNLGTINYACTDAYTCPGAFSWRDVYFSSTSGWDLATWGWSYKTPKNGSWTNADSGNSGDITG